MCPPFGATPNVQAKALANECISNKQTRKQVLSYFGCPRRIVYVGNGKLFLIFGKEVKFHTQNQLASCHHLNG